VRSHAKLSQINANIYQSSTTRIASCKGRLLADLSMVELQLESFLSIQMQLWLSMAQVRRIRGDKCAARVWCRLRGPVEWRMTIISKPVSLFTKGALPNAIGRVKSGTCPSRIDLAPLSGAPSHVRLDYSTPSSISTRHLYSSHWTCHPAHSRHISR
jgi:hypothetical protein